MAFADSLGIIKEELMDGAPPEMVSRIEEVIEPKRKSYAEQFEAYYREIRGLR